MYSILPLMHRCSKGAFEELGEVCAHVLRVGARRLLAILGTLAMAHGQAE
jgi:hypothetical protein